MNKEMNKMTEQELQAKAENYDNIHNEGADGYNPYRDEIKRREQAEPPTDRDRLDTLKARQRYLFSSAAEFGGSPLPGVAEERETVANEIKDLEAKIQEQFLAEWTLEVTEARRAEWNEFAKAELTGKWDKDKAQKMEQWQSERGWKAEDLDKALKLHGLA